MSHEITIKAPTPHEAIAFMASLVAPHFALRKQNSAEIAAAVDAGMSEARAAEPMADPASPPPPPPPTDTAAPAAPKPRRTRQKPGISTEPEAQPQPEQQRAIVILSPDGTTKTYETAGEALEGAADLLDLCESLEAVDSLSDTVAPIAESIGGDAQKAWDEMVHERKTAIAGPSGDPVDDLMPAGDKVGAKAQPTEMSLDNLDPPDFLKKSKLKIDDVRTAFLAMCKATTPATGKLLLDKYEKPRVGELGEDKWPAFYADCKKTSKLDDAGWSVALAEAAQIAAKK